MELLAGKRIGDDFAGDVNPFNSSDGGCEWMYSSRQSGNDDALATLADLAPPPQKLKPIRCVVKAPPSSDHRHPLDILAGTLEMGFGCFEAPLGTKIADVEESGQLACGFSKEDSLGDEMEFPGRNRTSWDGVSLSSSVDSDSDSSLGASKDGFAARKSITGKRKRETRDKMEHFLEKLVGGMMKRQEKMHNKLIKVMEKMEHERVRREEAWRQQEVERMRQNEEARKQEMSRSLSLISFIKTVIGDEIEIEIPKPLSDLPQQPQNLPEQCENRIFESAGTQRDGKSAHSSGRRWPQEEVEALITSRSEVEEKPGIHKFLIWDEISVKMKEKGYERSGKKCKEKWENMNKYYKRITERGTKQPWKKQPNSSKTRAYFEKLGDLYKTNSGSADHSAVKDEE
ncbi:hypothetical protein AALP_AA6G101600 [Arabis alpina]|uniref:Myb-like domain-containing protein n=1 Tax=Arabis alpina TaxID=50452 RepID=A0A087GNA3_ARAAL|nr:hypothetical protein AALP_AA6G101600 [Arabis alpina]